MLAIIAATLLAAAPQQHDTVFLSDGGRVVGTVVEEGAQGVTIQMPDGTTRRFAPHDVSRIQYSDGTVSTPRAAQAPPPSQPPAYQPPPPQSYPPSYPPPPAYGPPRPYYPPPARPVYHPWPGAPVSPFYFALGMGGTFHGGDAEQGVAMHDLFGPQFGMQFEAGVRLVPALSLGLYADLGMGSPASAIQDQCNANGYSCSASTTRVGIMLRHSFAPLDRTNPWIGIGTGAEYASVSTSDYGYSQEQFSYSGWEMLRLQAGVDLRSNPVFGVGFYGGVSFGRYSSYSGPNNVTGVPNTMGPERTHATIEAGLRLVLFP